MKKLVIAFMALFGMFLLAGCDNPIEIQSPNGSWSSTSDDLVFEADVTDDSLEVYIVADDTKALYWKGDFTLPDDDDGDFIVLSNADTDALSKSLFGSSLEEKEFHYKNGIILFDFEAMGVTKEIILERK